jgi:hypothetical protein
MAIAALAGLVVPFTILGATHARNATHCTTRRRDCAATERVPTRLFSRALPLPRARSYRHRHRLHRDALSAAPCAAARAPRRRAARSLARFALCSSAARRGDVCFTAAVYTTACRPHPQPHARPRSRCAASKEVRAARGRERNSCEEKQRQSVHTKHRWRCARRARCAHLVARLGLPAAIQRRFSASSAAASVKPLREGVRSATTA